MPRIKRPELPAAEGDMTPMIDMTFQLIAFFMVLINFSEADQNEKIKLPKSELAKPADKPPASPITLQMTEAGNVILGTDEVPLGELRPLLVRERQLLEARKEDPSKATIIIRGDKNAKTGRVQELIKICQETGFETFALRAKQRAADAVIRGS